MSGDTQGGKRVDVRHDAQWWPGYVEAWRTKDGCWQVYVRFSVGGGVWYTAWVDADDVRPAGVQVRSSESHRQEPAAVPPVPEAPSPLLDEVGQTRRRRTGVRALWVGSAVAGLFAVLAAVGLWLGTQEGGAGTAGDTATQRVVDAAPSPLSHHGHHGPTVPTDEQPSPASQKGDVGDVADLDDAIAGCERRWRLQTRPRQAAQASLGQWRLHIVAMNRLMAGKITLAQANAFWDRTRLRAIRNVERFGRAYGGYRENAAACGRPRGVGPGASRGTGSSRGGGFSRDAARLQTCVRATDAGDRALAIAGRAIATWEHHVHDMMMLESGQLTPTQAGRRWLAKWRAGNRQLERYEDVAAQARQQRCL